MKIVFTDSDTVGRSGAELDKLNKFGEVVLYKNTLPEELAERIADADIALCNKTIFSAEAMSKAPSLRYIGLFATGYNNIDTDYTKKHGITVCNAGSYSTDAVAQHTFALILSHYSRVRDYDSFTKSGGWIKTEVFAPIMYEAHELSGKTIGIVGYGSIGRAVAKIARAFNMRVLCYSRSKKTDENAEYTDIDTLLSSSDIVTVHCPLNKESEKMFNREAFSKFKEGALFINTARGGVVDEQALCDALNSGHLGAAAVDTVCFEPMREDCPLLLAKNIIITPHIAWADRETLSRLIDIVIGNIEAYLSGAPINTVY